MFYCVSFLSSLIPFHSEIVSEIVSTREKSVESCQESEMASKERNHSVQGSKLKRQAITVATEGNLTND